MSAPSDGETGPLGPLQFRPRLGQSLAGLLVLIILLGLGLWQSQRLVWKTALLDRMAERMTAEPVSLPSSMTDPDAWDLRPVSVTGTFRHESEFHLGPRILKTAAGTPQPGYHVLTPFQRTDGTVILINRGFVPDAKRAAATRAEGQIAGPVTITGIARVPNPAGWLVPANQAAANQWFSVDLARMAAAIESPALLPLVIEADATANPGGLPVGGQTEMDMSNNHLGYALTWFGLAATLLGVWLAASLRRAGPSAMKN